MATFRRINLSVKKASGYGSYYVHATYKGKEIKVFTHDSELFDWLDDDSNKTKHQDAKRAAYGLIRRAYEELHTKTLRHETTSRSNGKNNAGR